MYNHELEILILNIVCKHTKVSDSKWDSDSYFIYIMWHYIEMSS